MEIQNSIAVNSLRNFVDARRKPRFKLEVDINIYTRTNGLLRGYTVDISESGISAMLRIEVPLGELVELDFTLPFGPVTIYAMARQKRAFRYGFQFLELDAMEQVIQSTCRRLDVEQPSVRLGEFRGRLRP
jgi:c-di-GMP-binding flagellar brake protein YcgR